MELQKLTPIHFSVRDFIRQHQMLERGEKILLAISGGVDSVTLAVILSDLGFQIHLAHVNFRLRGAESDADAQWLRQWAQERNFPIEIQEIPSDHWHAGINIQLEARRLRYAWFEKLGKELSISKLATAHHADDQAETILFQFFRGTGLAGLRGILPVSGSLIRPLLGVSKNEIVAFAREHIGGWREDASNEKTDYRRNQIRHQILPVIQSAFPGFSAVIRRNAERIRISENELARQFQFLEQLFLEKKGSDHQVFDWKKIQIHASKDFFLSELLHQNGIAHQRLDELRYISDTTQSRTWVSHFCRLELKNDRLILFRNSTKENDCIIIESFPGAFEIPGLGLLEVNYFSENQKPMPGKNIFIARKEKLILPLIIRPWAKGNRIKPLGMKGKSKLVSDLLTEKKMTQMEKERTLILQNGDGEIIWVLGLRPSATFAHSLEMPGTGIIFHWNAIGDNSL